MQMTVIIMIEDLHDHLLTAEERVANEFARSQRNWGVVVGHFCDYLDRSVCLR
jgi:hypothetical protein